MSLILSADCTLYYEEYGAGETLILLPGLVGTIESDWRRFIPDLARHCHVIAVDLRGHGRTDNPSGVLRLPRLVEDLDRLFDSLQIDQAGLCGYDFGGALALRYGVQHPERISTLVLHASKVFWTIPELSAALASLDPAAIQASDPVQAASLRQLHLPANGPRGWELLLDQSRTLLAEMQNAPPGEADLAQATFPVLVTLGDADEVVSRSETRELVFLLPDATLRILPGVSHPIQTVRKEPFLSSVISFIG